MKRRRTILKVIALLAAGAALNVAVAWGLAHARWQPLFIVIEEFPDLERANMRSLRSDPPTERIAPAWPRSGLECIGLRLRTFEEGESDGWPGGVGMRGQYFIVEAGWPLPSVHGDAYQHFVGTALSGRHVLPSPVQPDSNRWWRESPCLLPYAPLWPGFAINTLFYAGVLWVLCCGPFALRRMIRRRRGQCPACAYPTWGGGQSPVCTECGAAVTQSRLV